MGQTINSGLVQSNLVVGTAINGTTIPLKNGLITERTTGNTLYTVLAGKKWLLMSAGIYSSNTTACAWILDGVSIMWLQTAYSNAAVSGQPFAILSAGEDFRMNISGGGGYCTYYEVNE